MSGIRSGVATKISLLEPRALYTHCYGHVLNLAVQDGIKAPQAPPSPTAMLYCAFISNPSFNTV